MFTSLPKNVIQSGSIKIHNKTRFNDDACCTDDHNLCFFFLSGILCPTKACLSTSSTRSLRYGHLAYLMGERTTTRFNHLSRIFTVDGNLSSGKGELAKKLAESLGNCHTT